jgi:hypothetical protein
VDGEEGEEPLRTRGQHDSDFPAVKQEVAKQLELESVVLFRFSRCQAWSPVSAHPAPKAATSHPK